ncbi:hypothetical protein HZA33_05205 [Candidatus Pacearchaeota archaeon]|nr:hypothetical protein [Candidatus Pacearchaeota archaeon]
MTERVVKGNDLFFKDDIKIVEDEITLAMALPQLPVFRDDLQIFYKGHIFVPSRNPAKDYIKVYTETYGLEEIATPMQQEEAYFTKYKDDFKKLKSDFIKRVLTGFSDLEDNHPLKGRLSSGVISELESTIAKKYAEEITEQKELEIEDSGLIKKLQDSVFGSITGYERVLILDNKVYNLITFPEFIAHFKPSFRPSIEPSEKSVYEKVMKAAKSATPEELSSLLDKHEGDIDKRTLSSMKGKIWSGDRSFKLYLGGVYWIPEHQGSIENLQQTYQKMLEMKIKIDAVKEFLR